MQTWEYSSLVENECFPEGTVSQLSVSAWPLGCALSTHPQLCHQQAPAKSTQLLKESSFYHGPVLILLGTANFPSV